MTKPADRRRTGTRDRIRAVALELFATRGYDATSLAEVAERLGITRPAVYYHFRSKDQLLTETCAELVPAVRAISGAVPDALAEIDALLAGPSGSALVCAQVNEHVARGLPEASELLDAIGHLAARLAPGPGPSSAMRGRLALAAITMAHARGHELGGTLDRRREAALALAAELLARP